MRAIHIGESGRSASIELKSHKWCTRLGYVLSAVAEHQKTRQVKIIANIKEYFPRKYRKTLATMKAPNDISRDADYHLIVSQI